MTEPLVKEMKNQGLSLFLEEQVVSLTENETAIVETEKERRTMILFCWLIILAPTIRCGKNN